MSDEHLLAQWSSVFYDNNLLCTESIMIVLLSCCSIRALNVICACTSFIDHNNLNPLEF